MREGQRGFDLANMVMLREKRAIVQVIIAFLGFANLYQAFIYNTDWGTITGAFLASVVCASIGGVVAMKVPQ